MMRRAARRLIVFRRYPRWGCGKRRLAAEVGDLAAWRFTRLIQAGLRRRLCADPRWTATAATTPDRAATWGGRPRFAKSRKGQGGGPLGVRMLRALVDAPGRGPAVLIGSDIPAVAARHIADAFALLGRHDAVFGPATDGGFWLIGLKRLRGTPRRLLAGCRWSSLHALTDALATAPPNWSVGFAAAAADVDDGADYARWRAASRRVDLASTANPAMVSLVVV